MSKCRSCGADIKFIKLKSGKWNPCDTQKRTVIIRDEGPEVLISEDGEIIKGRFASIEDGANAVGYISHFATCPNADKFRKRGEQ